MSLLLHSVEYKIVIGKYFSDEKRDILNFVNSTEKRTDGSSKITKNKSLQDNLCHAQNLL